MPRPRKATAALELSGAFAKDPQRRASRVNEPKPSSVIGKPPAYFDAEHRAIWAEFVDEAAPGVLTKQDRKLLEVACRLTRKMRVVPGRMTHWLSALGRVLEEFGVDKDVIEEMRADLRSGFGMSAQEAALLKTCLQSMGFTPADRSKVNVPPAEPEKDEWSFLQ